MFYGDYNGISNGIYIYVYIYIHNKEYDLC